jgi:hypothetical protein
MLPQRLCHAVTEAVIDFVAVLSGNLCYLVCLPPVTGCTQAGVDGGEKAGMNILCYTQLTCFSLCLFTICRLQRVAA